MEPVAEYVADYRKLLTLREYKFAPAAVLDIGASDGVWSDACARVFPEAEYFLVEPQKYTYPYPDRPGTKRHWIYQAVGVSEGSVELKIPPVKGPEYSAFILPVKGGEVASRTVVPQTTVNRLLEQGLIRPPQLVKIDVQGYELEVMRGADRLFESAKVFFVETNLYRFWENSPVVAEVVAFFAERGFHVYDFSNPYRSPGELLSQIDLIFISEKCHMIYLRKQEPCWPTWDEP